jgi:hypothetical protein
MNTLFINGRQFQYEVEAYIGEFGYYHETQFYEGVETYTRKKYFLFGDNVTISKPKWVFTIHCNIESEGYTKSEIKEKIDKQIQLLERKKEIENGQII